MPIVHTNQFWDYIINEPLSIINKAKEFLTKEDYDYQAKEKKFATYYQSVSKMEIDGVLHETIRFPSGLHNWLANDLGISIENKPWREYEYDEDEVRDICKEVEKINPKFETRDYQVEAVLTSLNSFRSLIYSGVGSGKEQPCDIIIPTPIGFRQFGDLQIGDKVFGKNGKPQTITGIYPQGIKDVYKVSFRNGANVECGLEHLWTVKKNLGKNKTLSLKDIKDNYYKYDKRGFKKYLYSVDYIEPIEYEQKSYFIHPYLLGVLIGDGTLTTENIGFSCSNIDIEIVKKITNLLPKTYHLQQNTYPACPQYYIRMSTLSKKRNKFNLYKKEIKRLKLDVKSHLKFIPEEYLLGSIKQRKELLAGLLDTDGCCRKRTKSCSITYGTTSKKLAEDIQQLVFSLGGAATIRSYKRKNKNREFEVTIELLFNPFLLTRKRNNYISYRITNTIINIEKIRKTKCICIKVSNEDELYVTQNYIPTHNTSIMSIVCKILNNQKILILNDNNFILQQIYDRLISFNINDVSWEKSSEPDYSKQIVIMNTAGSDSRLNRKDEKYLSFLKNDVNTVIYDECQHVQSLTFFEPLFYINPDNLKHIIGYSGSPFRNHKRPFDDFDDFCTIAILGEPAFTYEMKTSIKENNIAQPYGYFINYKNKDAHILPQFKNNYYMLYRANITYNKARNTAGIEMLKFLDKYRIKTLASINNIKPGQARMKELKKQGIKSLFICGDETIYEWIKGPKGGLKLDKRKGDTETIKKAMSEEGYNIIFGSTVMDEGVDIDIFQAVVLWSAGKTPISGIQRIGRASRKKKNGQNVSFVIDFKDIGGNYIFWSQYEKRKQLMLDSGVKLFTNVLDFIQMIKDINK